jgi:tRNA modification GTPase
MIQQETICAIASASGAGAIAIIRLSGKESFSTLKSIFYTTETWPEDEFKRKLFFGRIFAEDNMIDEVLVGVFKSPHSFTGEDSVEIYCHGSRYIQKTILELLINQGVRLANPGEFTQRAFMNGKMDLSQAEAVADLIASSDKAAHQVAMNQMRGGFSNVLKQLREKLVNFSALLELELDFSEEDVEFANRKQLRSLLHEIKKEITTLIESFKLGNVIKNGIPVAIVGKPNVGKSTLLNTLLQEDRAIVSEIPGTTRDTIEDLFSIEGVMFRFIDTAGLRDSDDEIENLGIERTYQKIEQAAIVLYVVDVSITSFEEIMEELNDFREHITNKEKKFIIVANKIDQLIESPHHFRELVDLETVFISAKRNENIELLNDILVNSANLPDLSNSVILSNSRHFEALSRAMDAIENVENGFKTNIPSDLIAIDIKDVLYHIGSITGEVTNNEILGTIFGKFCVGK